jgi:hypothetical protein
MRWVGLACVLGCGGSAPPPSCPPSVVFLERAGGHYEPGRADDAAANLSVILDVARDLPPWPTTAASWDSVVACIRTGLAPFAAEVTEDDPGDAAHYELVFTTSYWGGSAGATSIAPDSCRADHQLGFIFGDALATVPRACQVALIAFGELAANLSLDDNCADFLNPAIDCMPMRSFVDATANCVDAADQPIACRCGGTTQNTFEAMAAAFAPCTASR